MAAPGEHHRQAALVGGGDHFGVLDRSARLDDGGRARVGDARRARRGTGRTRRTRRRCPSAIPAAAFITATLTASTRLICPAPTASVRSAPVKITVFDLTCAQTRHAKRSAVHSSAVGCRFVTTFVACRRRRPRRSRASRHAIALLHQAPPRNDRISLHRGRRRPVRMRSREVGRHHAQVLSSSPGSRAPRRRSTARSPPR